MAPRKASDVPARRKAALAGLIGAIGIATAAVVMQHGALGPGVAGQTQIFGRERLVKVEPLPELNAHMCPMPEPEMMPASASTKSVYAMWQAKAAAAGMNEPPRVNDATRETISKRRPLATMRDPNNAMAGVVIDPERNEVIIAEENNFSILVYDRMENTPPKAAMSEPKRMIQGENTFLEFACSVYVDPATGDIYGINNDALNWMTEIGRAHV